MSFRCQNRSCLPGAGGPCQPVAMARVALALWIGLWTGCADNPYVIGRLLDAGASNDAGDASAAPEPCPAGALFCGRFETEDLRVEWTTTTIIEDASLERTTARVHSGAGALRVESRGPDSAAVVVTSLPAQRSGTLYLRAYVYVASAWATETMNLFFIGDDPSEPFVGIDLNLDDGAVQVFSPQMTPARTTGVPQFPRDRWVCFRLEVVISDDAGAVRVYADDVLAVEVRGVDTLPAAGIHLFRAGVDWSSEQASFFEVYLDDIALGTSPLECF
jgi:hypothetical protein